MRKLMTVLLAAVFAVSFASAAWAQGFDGTLRGDVKDPKGLAIDGAKVTIKNEATGEERHTTTSSGSFNAPNLLVGVYTVTVEIEGFKKYVRKGVEVKQNQVTEVAISLELGSVTTVVEVTASGELVQTTTSTLANTWDNRAVVDITLPSLAINPDPQNLAILLPGTTTQSGGVAGYGGAIGGNRPRDNNFVLDGVDNNRIDVTGPTQPVIPDAIGELTIITNQFSAEYGHSTAGQFIMNTKSGTNQLHGSAFWYNNNRAYNSVDNITKGGILSGQSTGKPRFDLNRLGGSVGGPVIKDHWFIFGAYQYTTVGAAALPGSAVSVPTAAGIASLQTLATTPGSGVQPYMVKVFSDVPAAPVQSGTETVTNFAGAGSTVTIPIGTIAPSAPNFQAEHDFAISSDVQTGKHRFSGRFLYDRFRAPGLGSLTVPAFTGAQFADNRSITFSDVYVITPHIVNELRAGYRRNSQGFSVPSGLAAPGALDVYPNFVITSLGLTLGPNGCFPQGGIINTYQWSDTLSISKGAHTLKMGTQVSLWISPSLFLARSRAEYDYTNLNEFVHDSFGGSIPLPFLALRGIGSGTYIGNQKGFYPFFQDDWKVTSKLTLNLGIRYEYVNNPRANEAQAVNAISNVAVPTNPGVPPLFFKSPATDTNNWGPRIGFAYDVFGDHKTSIRGGFAVAYDVLFNNFYSAGSLPPQLQAEENLDLSCTFPAPFTPKYCPLLNSGTQLSAPLVGNGGLPQSSPLDIGALSQADARAATSGFIPDSVNPKVLTWSLGVQHELGKDYAIELRYVGTHGISLPAQIRLNARLVAPASAFLPTFFTAASVPATIPASAPNLASFLKFGVRAYAPEGFAANVTAFEPWAQSIYHGGSVELTRRFSGLGRWGHGAFLKTSYTYSKEIDDGTNEFFTSFVNPRRAQDGLNLSADRGRGAIDHTHKVVLAAIYEIPWYSGSNAFMKGLTNGWEISPTFVAESGQPVTLLNFIDTNHNGDAAGDRPILNPGFTVANSTSDVNVVCRNGTSGGTFISTSTGSVSTDSNGVVTISGCAVGQGANLPPPPPPPLNSDGSVATTTKSANKFAVGYVAACAPGEVGCTKNPNAQYVTAQVGAVSTVGRDTITSAGINNWNFTILKRTNLWSEGRYVEFRASFVNAFNHAQPTVGGGSIEQLNANSSAPGQAMVQVTDPNINFLRPENVFSTGSINAPFQRVISFGLRVVF